MKLIREIIALPVGIVSVAIIAIGLVVGLVSNMIEGD